MLVNQEVRKSRYINAIIIKWTGRHYHMKKFLRTFRTWPSTPKVLFGIFKQMMKAMTIIRVLPKVAVKTKWKLVKHHK